MLNMSSSEQKHTTVAMMAYIQSHVPQFRSSSSISSSISIAALMQQHLHHHYTTLQCIHATVTTRSIRLLPLHYSQPQVLLLICVGCKHCSSTHFNHPTYCAKPALMQTTRQHCHITNLPLWGMQRCTCCLLIALTAKHKVETSKGDMTMLL